MWARLSCVRRASLALAAGALVCSSASGAAANGRYPQSNQLAFSPTDPTLVVLRTTFGILISHDGGTTWSWLCEDVVGVPSTSIADPVLAVTQKSIVGAPEIANGLVVSSDSGCNWSTAGAPLSTQSIKDLVVKPDAPDDVLALTSTYGPDSGADGAPGYLQQVYESDDDGATWSAIGGSNRSERAGHDNRPRCLGPRAHVRVCDPRRERDTHGILVRLRRLRRNLGGALRAARSDDRVGDFHRRS